MRPQGFPAKLRLKQRREFLRVQRGGHKIHVRHFMVFCAPRRRPQPKAPPSPKEGAAPAPGASLVVQDSGPALPPTRSGITVTRKVGNAVVRNRIKRLVREVFRLNRTRLPQGLDIVWVAKKQAAGASFAQVSADLEALLIELERRPLDKRGGRGKGRGGGKARRPKTGSKERRDRRDAAKVPNSGPSGRESTPEEPGQ